MAITIKVNGIDQTADLDGRSSRPLGLSRQRAASRPLSLPSRGRPAALLLRHAQSELRSWPRPFWQCH
jgi:hypothetical protein